MHSRSGLSCALHRALLFAAFTLLSSTLSAAAEEKRRFDIAAGEAQRTLNEFSRQAELQIFFDADTVRAFFTNAIAGEFEAADALEEMLGGTGLAFEFVNKRTIAVMRRRERGPSKVATTVMQGATDGHTDRSASKEIAQPGSSRYSRESDTDDAEDSRSDGQGERSADSRGETQPDVVVVTGTRIRGVTPDSSPLAIYGREQIQESGAATIDQFARKIPENFASMSTELIGVSAPGGIIQSGGNSYKGAGFNLRGLGPGATLTLLNGHRVAPAGNNGEFVDVSLIPLSAIARIEVLADGASALYGADAVAGVVNIVLREDFEGAETGVRFGGTSDGGASERSASQLLGSSWNTGNAFVVYEYREQDPLFTTDREFVPVQTGPVMLLPEEARHSVVLTGKQRVFADNTMAAELFFGDRDYRQINTSFGGVSPTSVETTGDAEQRGGALELDAAMRGDWRARIIGSYSAVEQGNFSITPSLGGPGVDQTERTAAKSASASIDLIADGPLFSFSTEGREVNGAIGASYRREKLRKSTAAALGSTPLPGSGTAYDLGRKVTSVYAEVFLPLLEETSGQAHGRLELSLAGRYDHYDDFGSSTNPRIGVVWSPASWLNVRSTFARSFRPPLLVELIDDPFYFVLNLPDPQALDGTTTTLSLQSAGNPALTASTSRSWTAGFDFRPPASPDLSIVVTYFQIRFDDRISRPPLAGGIFRLYRNEAERLAAFIDRSPDPASVAAAFASGRILDFSGMGSSGVEARFDILPLNIARSQESGIDVSVAYQFETNSGTWGFSATGNYLLENEYRAVSTSPEVSVLNLLGQPVDLRARGHLSWSRGAFASSLGVNYWTSYENSLFTPARDIPSWTTGDLQLSYQTGGRGNAFLSDLTVALSIQNVTDENPPLVEEPPGPVQALRGYDSANASALGRLGSLELRKRW